MNELINSVQLIGNVGKEIELKAVGESQVARFSFATNETYKNDKGEKVQDTDWHNCEAWGGLAEQIGKYVTKGSKVIIKGRVKNDNYTNKDGDKVYGNKIVVSSFLVMDGFKEE